MAALKGCGPLCGQDLSAELAGDVRGGQVFRSCLPISANDEGGLKVVQELKELTQNVGIEWGLKRFPRFEIELNEMDLTAISLKGKSRPAVSLLSVCVDVVNEVSGGMDGEESPGGSSMARGLSCHPVRLPASAGEVLLRSLHSLLLEVSLLEEHDGVSLTPYPVLHLFAKEGDVAEGEVKCFVTNAGFLGFLAS